MTEYITGRGNPLLKQVRALGRSADERREKGAFVVDGEKLIMEAIRWNVPITHVFTSSSWLSAHGAPTSDAHTSFDRLPFTLSSTRHIVLPDELLEAVSPMSTTQGVLAVCQMPRLEPPQTLPSGRYLILDRLQDPGNVGAVLRSAAAFGAGAILLCEGCADPFSPKAVRAAMGAVFHIRMYRGDAESLRQALNGVPIYTASPYAGDISITDISTSSWAVVIGQEGAGVSDYWRESGSGLYIPMESCCESLNAAMAAAIVLWESYRRRSLP